MKCCIVGCKSYSDDRKFVDGDKVSFHAFESIEMSISLLSETNNTLIPIESLVQIIITRFLTVSYCLVFVSEVKIDFQVPIGFTTIATNGTNIDNLVDQMIKVVEMGCSDYIVRLKEPSVFMKAYDKVGHQANARRSDKKVVLLPYQDDEYVAEKLLNILSMKEASFLANLLLIIPDVSNTSECTFYYLVTNRLIGPDTESNHPVYLDKWSSCGSYFEKDADLFPHGDLSNVYGKTLKVACFTYKPYVLLDVDTSIIATGRDGTEIRIVHEFCRWINCSIQIVNAEKEQWGELYENGTGIGVLGSVFEDRADVGITALYSWYEEYLYLDFSSASIRTAITCIAPSPRLLISWEMPLAPFDWNLWICMLLTIVVSALVLILAQGTSDKAFLISFGILIAQSYNDTNVSWRKRRVTGWLILAGLILCNAYGAGLASTFTVPKYEKPIDTIQDILDTKSEWGATHDAWIFSIALSKEPSIMQLVKQFKIYDFDELKRKSFTRSMLFSVEKLPSGSFAIGEYITEEAVRDYRLMQEDFYYEQNVVMLRKSSMYTQKISALIGRLHESGLMLAWETQVALQHLNYKVQTEVKLSRSKKEVEIVPLSFLHIVGIFYMYVFGIALSTILFIIELVSKRDKSKMPGSNNIRK